MNVICTINDKKKKKTYKLEELTPKQREEYGRKINESGMAAMGYKYLNVPKSVYDALMSASSHGGYLAAHIKGVYTYQKIS